MRSLCAAQLTRNILNPRQCGITLPYLPPPFTARIGRICRQLDLERYNAKTSINGTTNSFILPQPVSTLAISAVMSKRFVPKFTKQSHVRGQETKGSVLPTHVSTAIPTGRAPSRDVALLSCQDVDPCELT